MSLQNILLAIAHYSRTPARQRRHAYKLARLNRKKIQALLGMMVLLAPVAFGSVAQAQNLPEGGKVVGGQANISQSGNTMNINQSSQRAIMNWKSFNIGQGNTVDHKMPRPDSAALHRVTGNGSSQLAGQLKSNGNVFLVNPNGVVIHKGARIDTGGFVATTHDIKNSDFMAGRNNFSIPGNPGASIINRGDITVRETGFAALVAPSVRNEGVIAAKLGKVALGSGDAFTLDLHGDELIQFHVDNKTADTLYTPEGEQVGVENTGTIKAEGGIVIMTASQLDGIVSNSVNNSGIVTADSARVSGGKIIFGATGDINNTGTVTASSSNKDGGTVRMVAEGKAKISGTIAATGAKKGGLVDITGKKETILVAANIQAGGTSEGLVRIGGEFQGGQDLGGVTEEQKHGFKGRYEDAPELASTDKLTVDAASTISAGDDGTVIGWSDGATNVDGSWTAKYLETSGKYLGISEEIDVRAGDVWLLDPLEIIISDTDNSNAANPGQDPDVDGKPVKSNVKASWLVNELLTNPVTLQAVDIIKIAVALDLSKAQQALSLVSSSIYIESDITLGTSDLFLDGSANVELRNGSSITSTGDGYLEIITPHVNMYANSKIDVQSLNINTSIYNNVIVTDEFQQASKLTMAENAKILIKKSEGSKYYNGSIYFGEFDIKAKGVLGNLHINHVGDTTSIGSYDTSLGNNSSAYGDRSHVNINWLKRILLTNSFAFKAKNKITIADDLDLSKAKSSLTLKSKTIHVKSDIQIPKKNANAPYGLFLTGTDYVLMDKGSSIKALGETGTGGDNAFSLYINTSHLNMYAGSEISSGLREINNDPKFSFEKPLKLTMAENAKILGGSGNNSYRPTLNYFSEFALNASSELRGLYINSTLFEGTTFTINNNAYDLIVAASNIIIKSDNKSPNTNTLDLYATNAVKIENGAVINSHIRVQRCNLIVGKNIKAQHPFHLDEIGNAVIDSGAIKLYTGSTIGHLNLLHGAKVEITNNILGKLPKWVKALGNDVLIVIKEKLKIASGATLSLKNSLKSASAKNVISIGMYSGADKGAIIDGVLESNADLTVEISTDPKVQMNINGNLFVEGTSKFRGGTINIGKGTAKKYTLLAHKIESFSSTVFNLGDYAIKTGSLDLNEAKVNALQNGTTEEAHQIRVTAKGDAQPYKENGVLIKYGAERPDPDIEEPEVPENPDPDTDTGEPKILTPEEQAVLDKLENEIAAKNKKIYKEYKGKLINKEWEEKEYFENLKRLFEKGMSQDDINKILLSEVLAGRLLNSSSDPNWLILRGGEGKNADGLKFLGGPAGANHYINDYHSFYPPPDRVFDEEKYQLQYDLGTLTEAQIKLIETHGTNEYKLKPRATLTRLELYTSADITEILGEDSSRVVTLGGKKVMLVNTGSITKDEFKGFYGVAVETDLRAVTSFIQKDGVVAAYTEANVNSGTSHPQCVDLVDNLISHLTGGGLNEVAAGNGYKVFSDGVGIDADGNYLDNTGTIADALGSTFHVEIEDAKKTSKPPDLGAVISFGPSDPGHVAIVTAAEEIIVDGKGTGNYKITLLEQNWEAGGREITLTKDDDNVGFTGKGVLGWVNIKKI